MQCSTGTSSNSSAIADNILYVYCARDRNLYLHLASIASHVLERCLAEQLIEQLSANELFFV